MQNIWAGLSGRTVADHELNFFVELDGIPIDGPNLTIAALANGSAACWPADQLPAMRGRYGVEPVWVGGEGDPDIGDFHPHVARLVRGMRADLMRVYEPSEQVWRLLKSGDLYEKDAAPVERTKKRIGLDLSPAALARLAAHGLAARTLEIKIESINLHVFATGKSFALVKATVSAAGDRPNALELLEAQIALGRVHKLFWFKAQSGDPAPLASFELLSLVTGMAVGTAAVSTRGERISSYAFTRLDGTTTPAESDLYGLHLARHYTTDYLITDEIGGVGRVATFDTVRTIVANEGAATVLGQPPALAALPSFLQGFKTATFRRHYLPIALLALHEQAFLVHQTSRAILERGALGRPATVASLRNLLSDTLLFRLGFRFSEVSYISMHNELNRAFRAVMSLDRMLRDLSDDVAAIEAFLRMKLENERAEAARATERRFYWTSVLGAMALSGLTTFTIAKEAAEAFFDGGEWGAQVATVLGVAVAVATWFVGRLRRPHTHVPSEHADAHGGFIDHAMVEHMLHTAGKQRKGVTTEDARHQ